MDGVRDEADTEKEDSTGWKKRGKKVRLAHSQMGFLFD